MENCCQKNPSNKKSFWSGIIYGLVPHIFCIAFVVLSLIGAVSSTALIKKFLLIPYFFLLLTIISFFFATLAAFFYLKKNNSYNLNGIKKNQKYLLTLYTVTIITNILVAYLIIPLTTNRPARITENTRQQSSQMSINVQIPCPGHAPLIIDEVKKINGVEIATFKLPRTFEITYNPQKTSPEEIAALEIFTTFKLKYN